MKQEDILKLKSVDYVDRIGLWLRLNERNKSWLARQCNVSPTAVQYWFELSSKPSNKHKIMIKEITGIEE